MNKDEFLSEYAVDRRNTCCVKWDDLKESFGEDGLLPIGFLIRNSRFRNRLKRRWKNAASMVFSGIR